jgi:hypothetical protein
MYFQIRKLILWRRSGAGKRIVNFRRSVVNVISGASKTGKSAVIPIIDYCLASDFCSIPVGVIREHCEWFGIVVETLEGEKLLARREPGDQRQTGDMFVLEAPTVDVPDQIVQRNSNTGIVKSLLDRVAGLSDLGFDPESDNAFKARPSFRDLMAFTFQPQNIIANPDVLFFKADTTEHREKLKTIFPYVLSAITAKDLATKWEIDRIQRTLRRKETELQAALASANAWKAEATAWINQASDLGLLPAAADAPQEWPDILALLRSVAESSSRIARPTVDSIEGGLAHLESLRKEETATAEEVSSQRQRLNEVRRLINSSDAFGSAIRVQRDRLALSAWIHERAIKAEDKDAMAELGSVGRQDIESLVSALQGIELQVRSYPAISDRLDREQVKLRGGIEASLDRLAAVRQEIALFERESEKARRAAYGLDQVERFLGRLQQALTINDRTDTNADLRQEVSDLRHQLESLRREVSEQDIARRFDNARRTVEGYAEGIVPDLDAEWPHARLRLITTDLTIKVIRGNRDDYLWEIGSGANWLAYHVAITLALQRVFLDTPHHAVPALLVYDQPSQVYFPRRSAGDDGQSPEWRDEDVVAVRKVFCALASEVLRAQGRLQVIVLDHADSDVWGGIRGVQLIEEWRGENKLVPVEWLSNA